MKFLLMIINNYYNVREREENLLFLGKSDAFCNSKYMLTQSKIKGRDVYCSQDEALSLLSKRVLIRLRNLCKK